MAKCGICKSRKGKRFCIGIDAEVCSSCCGRTRTKEKCSGCGHFKDMESIRDYKKVPYFTVGKMDSDDELASFSYSIERDFR